MQGLLLIDNAVRGGGVTQKQIFTMNLKKILEWYETKFLKMLLKKIPTDIAIDTPN